MAESPEPARHHRIKEVFLAAQALPESERESLLSRDCAIDPELRSEV